MTRTVVRTLIASALCIHALPAAASAEDAAPNPRPAAPAAPLPDEMGRMLNRQEALQDVAQFRDLLKREWMLANLNDANFAAALDQVERGIGDRRSVAELTLQLHRVLCLGRDGHAQMQNLLRAFDTVKGVNPKFILEPCGDRYIAYLPEHVAAGRVNPNISHRFVLLKDGYPYLESIDGVPIETWIKAVDPYVPRAPELARRFHCTRYLTLRLPFFRRELKLPPSPTVRVRLVSQNGADKIDLDATFTGAYSHLNVPKPDWEILDGNIGYLSLPTPAGDVTAMIVAIMPKLRSTKGLVLDLRGNQGGAGTENLRFMASYLVSPNQPHVVAGQFVRWKDARKTGWMNGTFLDLDGLDDESRASSRGLTDHGRAALSEFATQHPLAWKPPTHRETATAYLLLSRLEAEPAIYPYNQALFPQDTYYYDKPVVVLFDHRCFSAGEIFVAGMRSLPNVTLIGTPTTACGGGATGSFTLANSRLNVWLTNMVYASADGQLLDGIGIRPDIVATPEVGYYLGTSDRMLDKAIEVLKGKSAPK